MPRINHVKKCRKDQGRCSGCGKDIPIGSAYKWFAKRFGPRYKFHSGCNIRPSQLSGSKYAVIYDAIEDGEEEIDKATNGDELKDVLQTVADMAREVAEEYEESYSNMEEQFPSGCPVMEQIEEYKDECEQFADTLESWDASDYEDDEEMPPEEGGINLEDARDAARDALQEFSL